MEERGGREAVRRREGDDRQKKDGGHICIKTTH